MNVAQVEGGSAPADSTAGASVTPTIRRRMAAFAYEGLLLIGVLMVAGFIYSSLTQMRHALVGTLGLQVFLFCVLAAYFGWFWTHGGQTLAMRAWQIRLVDTEGRAVTPARAMARFALAWLWFLPALAALHFGRLSGTAQVSATLAAGIAGYALLAWLQPKGQFWHDMVCGTRLIMWQPKRSPKTTA